MRSTHLFLGAAALALLLVASAACVGKGTASYEDVAPTLASSCGSCHDAQNIGKLVGDVAALDPKVFTDANFPPEHFPTALRAMTTKDIVAANKEPGDGAIDPNAPAQQAWVLHELHELQGLLGEDPAPDYLSAESFNHFVTAGKQGEWEGCELAEKLELGEKGDPEGMPPLWAKKLLELLGRDHQDLTEQGRQDLKDYVDAVLPGGLKMCSAGPGESS